MKPGRVIADRFQLEELAGSGGMGEVYRARDLISRRTVALKLKIAQSSPESAERFEREATAIASLDHPGVVGYAAHGEADGRLYLAMEWLDGEDLSRRLERGRLSLREASSLGARVADALAAAHAAGIVHRDIKPSNLFLTGKAIEGVKIIDFGIARVRWKTRQTQTGAVVGTPGYMAPEQLQGGAYVDARCDVFALGCVLHECLTGEPAFEAAHVLALLVKILFEEAPLLRDRRSDVPEALDHLVARMLAKDPAGRPAVAEVAAGLREIEAAPEAIPRETAPPREVLTQGEQRVVCVILAGAVTTGAAPDATLTWDQASSHAALEEVVQDHGGELRLLFDGTAAVTFADAGVATDQARRAARCALSLRRALPVGPMVLATGRGEMSGRRASGEAIDRAAAMMQARRAAGPSDGPPRVEVDSVTAGLLDQRFVLATTPSGIELAGESHHGGTARLLLGKPTRLWGRDRELATLEGIFADCNDEPAARVVIVSGEAGVGKSRLRQEIQERLERRDPAVRIWRARGDPMRAGAPFGLVGQLIRQAAELLDGEPLDARRDKLAARVAAGVDVADRGRVTEFIGELVGAHFPDEGRVQLRAARHDPQLMGDQMRRAWVDFVGAETRTVPVVLVLEDLHWGDQPSVEYVDAALRLLHARPLMVLALARPEVHDLFPKLWSARSAQEIRLGELSRRACERMIRGALGDDLPDDVVTALSARSSGNAFFLEELIRATAAGQHDDFPETMMAMVSSRLEGLPAEDRRLLRAASIFGQAFWRSGLLELLGAGASAGFEDRLKSLERQEWIVQRTAARFRGEPEYVFRHALQREATYATLTAADRTLGHRLAAGWLEAAGETDGTVLAGHFERGDEPGRATGHYRAAAEQALGGNDLGAVLDRVDRAIACGAGGELLGELSFLRATAHNWRGEHAEADRWARGAMAALPERGARWYAAAENAVWAAGATHDTARLLDLSTLLRSPRLEPGPPEQVIAMTSAEEWLLVYGRYEEARALHADAERVAARFSDDPALSAAIHRAAAVRAVFEGDPDACREGMAAAVARYEEAGNQRGACLARISEAWAHAELGAYAAGVESARLSILEGERMGLPAVVRSAKSNLGMMLARTGEIDAARTITIEAVNEYAAQGSLRGEGFSRLYLARILQLAGDLGEAEAEARRALEVLGALAPLLPYALAVLAEVLRARGDHRGALESALRGSELLESGGPIEEGESLVRLAHAEALDACGDAEAARRVIAAAAERLTARAAKIGSLAARRSFLEKIPENARTMELSLRWLAPSAGADAGPSAR